VESSRLPPYGACLLGSVNLARLVAAPFEDGSAPWTSRSLTKLVRVAVRMMDNVVDESRFPLEATASGGAGEAAHRAWG
jgi:ribonucleoside-diphosphate reductase alpha chain